MDNSPIIKLELTVDEANHILNCLQDRPYREVRQLIDKIVLQANAKKEESPPE